MNKYFLLSLFLINNLYANVIEPSSKQSIENLSNNKDFQKSVEDYLNGITALTSDFVQTNPNGTQVQGKLWLKRSKKDQGKMRLDYDLTVGQRIIAKDDMLTIYDLKDKSEAYYTLDSTPAAFILKNNLSLSKDVQVVNLQKTTSERILVKLTRLNDSEGMSLTLIFSLYSNGHIKSLIGWIVIDGQGNETIVELVTDKMHVNDQKLVNDKIFLEPFIE